MTWRYFNRHVLFLDPLDEIYYTLLFLFDAFFSAPFWQRRTWIELLQISRRRRLTFAFIKTTKSEESQRTSENIHLEIEFDPVEASR